MSAGIRAIVFDLDGTLYVNEGLAGNIRLAASEYVAGLTGMPTEAAADLIRETRERLSLEQGTEATLTSVCIELGGDIAGFHSTITPRVRPEMFLNRDEAVAGLIADLASRFELYIYTNNNRALAGRILDSLGLSGLFRGLFTIEDFRGPKPDREVLEMIFSAIDRRPEECLFVGDRYDVDLRVPAEMGSAVFLVSNTEELLNLPIPDDNKDR